MAASSRFVDAMRVSPGEEPKSNWEKRRLLVGLRSGRWPCHLRVVAQVVITTLLVVGILKMHEMWILFKVANAVGRAAASQGDRLSQDAISKEILNLVRRMLSSQLSSEDLRASLSILSTPSAPSTCARWDVYDAQLERCFIMDPGVVLWFGGYASGSGYFVSELASRLKGIVSPSAIYENANCFIANDPVGSLVQYSYSLTDTAKMHRIYSTCKASRVTDDLRGVQRGQGPSPSLARRLCADIDWCIRSITPHRIFQMMMKFDKIEARPASEEKNHGKTSSIYGFLSVDPHHIHSSIQDVESIPSSNLSQHCSLRLPADEIGGWNETFLYFRYLWRCKIHFAVARYGDGELAVMSGREYSSETDLKNWSFKPDFAHKGYVELVNLMTDGFRLAAEHTKENAFGGMFIGLPFHFCAQGSRDFRMGGGGHYDWLMEYLTRFSHLLHAVNAHRLVYSWQWGHFNYPAAIDLVGEMGAQNGGIILICNEHVLYNRERLPQWAKVVLTVPGDGVRWMTFNVEPIKRQAARVARAAQNQVFAFSAGPLSNALIPLMFRINPNNTYIDFGAALDYSVHSVRTRPFHPHASSAAKPWMRADGSLNRDQTCDQTRWSVFYEPRVVPLDGF